MNPEQLKTILEEHKLWLDTDGADGRRADLSEANLSGADLSGANLHGADLYRANLHRANLSGANLYRANLYRANLHRANLSGANLYRANLYRANLYRANLHRANLSGANLYGADLYRANLSGANLHEADLHEADLRGADLRGANLTGAIGLPSAPAVPNIDARILAAIETGGDLQMNAWHTCDTTHCLAGWAITLAGAEGRALEEKYGPAVAGTLIFAASSDGSVPDFYADNEDALVGLKARAMADMKKRAAR